MNREIGVIIQGPLTTYGQGPNNSREGFDAFSAISKNVESIENAGFKYVISTWMPENRAEEGILSKIKARGFNIIVLGVPEEFDPDHRYKHHYGIFIGLNKLTKDRGIDFIVKIRTDMEMPEDFWGWVAGLEESGDQKLYVSELYNYPFYLGDFIYAARKDVFSEFISSIIKCKGEIIHPCIAADLGAKYCGHLGFFALRKKYFQELHLIFQMLFKGKSLSKTWGAFAGRYLGTMPEDIWSRIIWRGKKIDSFLNSRSFIFNTSLLSDQMLGMRDGPGILADYYIKYGSKAKKYLCVRSLFRVPILVSAVVNKARIIYHLIFPKKIILARTACLGLDIIKQKTKNMKTTVINQQKTRVDLFLDWLDGTRRPRADIVEKHLARKDVLYTIKQQEELPWLCVKGKIEYLVMDSFSELTDQKFVHKKEGWAFACHYSDINHTPEFEKEFSCEGLLDLALLEKLYIRFFDWFKKSHPDCPVYYLHFPTSRDKRELFKARGTAIMEVVGGISGSMGIKSVHVGDEYVVPHETDDFPYHYGKLTHEKFAEKMEVAG